MLRARLEAALGEQIEVLPEGAWRKLEELDALLLRWTSAVGLVGYASETARHLGYFGDALAAARFVPERGSLIDIGSGGGTPALPLAVVRPELSFRLVESNSRKAVFLEEAARELALDNVVVLPGRYENVRVPSGVDAITLRGVALGAALLAKIDDDLAPGGRFVWLSSRERATSAAARLDSFAVTIAPLPGRGGAILVATKA